MDGSLDDDIELLKNSHDDDVDENPGYDEEGLNQLNSGINPLAFIPRGCSVDESIHQGSLHALKTAFSALQKKHNVQSRKYADLTHRNKALERMISNEKLTERLHGNILNMEGSSEVHAAGGTSEDETALAVNRANQGYVQHLERELLIAKNKVYKATEEINTLKVLLNEKESKLIQVIKEKDTILSDFDCLKENFDLTNAEVKTLNEKLTSEKSLNERLRLDIENLRQRLENLDRSSNNKDTEVSNYQSSLSTAKTELMKTTMQYRDLQKRVESLDKENSALKATCKQYEIEVEISRKQRRDQMDDVDDVDGDVAALNKALNLLSSQREEVCSLKAKIVQQSKTILQIQQNDKIMHLRSKSFSGLNSPSLRQDPYGAVSSPRCEENYHRPQNHDNHTSRHSPLRRRESERSDYSTGKRVNDSILPTGNKNITPMFAMESNPHVKRNELAYHGNGLVPALNFGPQNNVSQKTNLTGNHHIIDQQNRRSSSSPRSGADQGAYGTVSEYSNFSPRTRQTSSPGSDTGYSPANDLGTYSATTRQQVPNIGHNYMNMPNDDKILPQISPQMQPNIPMRMTQSEVIIRDKNLKGARQTSNVTSHSVFEPVLPFNIADTNGASKQLLLGEMEPEETRFNQVNVPTHMYENQFQEKLPGPDYENVYKPKPQTDRKNAVEHESEDNTFCINNSGVSERRSPPQHDENADNVAVLNICPSCHREFSRLTFDQFQDHVVSCFDSSDDQPATLQATGNDDDRTCPMCGAAFPLTIAQQTFEQHVLSHFGDDPGMERFEMLQ